LQKNGNYFGGPSEYQLLQQIDHSAKKLCLELREKLKSYTLSPLKNN
jgi:hypothetical protein